MKTKFIYLLLLMALGAQAQTIPSYKNIKLTATAENPSATKLATKEDDNTFGYILKSNLIDIIEANTAAALPVTGVAGKIYVTLDNNKIYRWNGTFYQELAVTDITGKVDKNAPITGATKTKITYDAKGLVTSGTDLVASDIPTIAQSQVTNLTTDLATKVDKVAGKGLSTEDYTTAEKTKLAGIQAAATANATDAQLRDRATHTGTQAINTVIGLQAAIDAKINLSLVGANNGITPLDPGGKVSFAYLPASLMIYKGMWNPATNTPTLADGTGVAGWVYKASASGTIDLGSGNLVIVANDFIIHNGTKWEWSSGTDAVVSVNGQQGVVTLNTSHIPEVTNKRYQTDAQNTNNNATSPIQGQIDGKAPLSGSSNYIQNQASSPQSANMWISGVGVFGGDVAAGRFSLQGTNDLFFSNPFNNWSIKASDSENKLNFIDNQFGVTRMSFSSTTTTFASTVTAPTFVGNLTGNASSATNWGARSADLNANAGIMFRPLVVDGSDSAVKLGVDTQFKSWLGLGSNAYTSTDYFKYETFTADANTLAGNRSAFTYANNAPHDGTLVHFDAIGYGTQINTSYNNSGNTFSFRTRNGDNQSWNPWRSLWHDGNFNPANYLPLTGNSTVNGIITATGFKLGATDQISWGGGFNSGKPLIEGSAIGLNIYPKGNLYDGILNVVGAGVFTSSVTANGGMNLVSNNVNNDNVSYTITNTSASKIYSFTTGKQGITHNGVGIWNRTDNTHPIWFEDNGTATLSSSVTATAFFQSSDRRLKTIIKRDGDVAYFKWKDGRDSKTHIGYIAQEVRKNNPNQVQKGEDKMLSVNYVEILVEKVRLLEKRIEELEKK